MLYMPIVKAIEDQIKKHSQLAKLNFYRFSLPESSVRSPFACVPWVQSSEFSAHSNACISDDVSDMCIGNFYDKHEITLPILTGVAKYNTSDAEEMLDELQDGVIEQIKADRGLGGAVRFAEPHSMKIDSFVEISPNHIGAILLLDVKYIDVPHIPELNWIESLVGTKFYVEETY